MIFITGTDTGCGKTTVGRAISAALNNRGVKVGVFKPIETGCEDQNGFLVASDATLLSVASGCELSSETICPYKFRLPASPERAAEAEGKTISLEKIASSWKVVAQNSQFAIAEGAGGLLVPISAGVMMIDLPLRLKLPVLLVSKDALGTVNHTLLSIESLRSRGISIAGIVFSNPDPEQSSLENARAIFHYSKVPIFGSLPHLTSDDDGSLAQAAEKYIDLDAVQSCSI